MRRPAAILFDVDGTLVDSNYHHVVTWQRAFAELGKPVEARRIHERIGKGGSLLIHELLGDVSDDVEDRAKELHSTYFGDATDSVQVVPGARELIRAVHGAGVRVVLASSAGSDEFDSLRKILDVDKFVYASTSSADVDQEKPHPSLVETALEKAGATADRAVMVGDAVWDVIAAKRAGVPTIGLLSGGISRAELLESGAAAVYSNAAELLTQIDASPLAALLSG